MERSYSYRVGKIRSLAENYHEYRRIAYDGCRPYQNTLDGKNWEQVIEMIADFDIAVKALGMKTKFYKTLEDSRFHLSSGDFRDITNYLNGRR